MRLMLQLVLLLVSAPILVIGQDGPSFETKSIFFRGGDWYVDGEQLQELYDWIDAVPDLHEYEIIIHSHTDNIGSKEYNAWLSQMRSNSVYELLLKHAIPQDWLFIRDYGEENPDFDNFSHMGRIHNRRVDVVLIPPAS